MQCNKQTYIVSRKAKSISIRNHTCSEQTNWKIIADGRRETALEEIIRLFVLRSTVYDSHTSIVPFAVSKLYTLSVHVYICFNMLGLPWNTLFPQAWASFSQVIHGNVYCVLSYGKTSRSDGSILSRCDNMFTGTFNTNLVQCPIKVSVSVRLSMINTNTSMSWTILRGAQDGQCNHEINRCSVWWCHTQRPRPRPFSYQSVIGGRLYADDSHVWIEPLFFFQRCRWIYKTMGVLCVSS